MLYRESGDFSETYKADSQTFPIKFDRYRYYAVLVVAFLVIPLSSMITGRMRSWCPF